jgi:site-specific DNA-methyltransferase (adenine-specific)
MIAWVYGSGFPKSLDVSKAIDKVAGAEREVVGFNENWRTSKSEIACPQQENQATITAPATPEAKQWEGWGTALKPALEPITVARKPLIGTVAENVLQHGTGAINVDGGRVGQREKEQFTGIKNGSINAYGDYFYPKGEKALPAGRWPANFIHDGSEEVVALFPDTKSGGGDKHGRKASTFCASTDWEAYKGTSNGGDSGSAARFFYCAKASKADRDEGLDGSHSKQMDESRKQGNPGGDNPRNRGVQERTNFHPTVKPTDLLRYLCRLVTPPNGIVLDPFYGSGSTGCAAVLEGFQYIGIEREAEYIAISEKRIQARSKQVQEQPKQLTLL